MKKAIHTLCPLLVFLGGIALSLYGCRPSGNIIPTAPFETIVYQALVANGIAVEVDSISSAIAERRIDLYSGIYQAHGYTQAQMDSTLRYYGQHPEELDKILDHVVARIQEQMAKLNALDSVKTPSDSATLELISLPVLD